MDKVVLVISFDAPQSEEEFNSTIVASVDALKSTLEHSSNRHVWFGVKEAADEVLKTIGVGDG